MVIACAAAWAAAAPGKEHAPAPADPQTLALLDADAPVGDADWLQRQRDLFPTALAAARAGKETALASIDRSYVLYPYVEAAWLRAHLADLPADRVTDFLRRHGDARPARLLRYHWLQALAEAGRWNAYLEVWPGVSRPDAELACHHVTARVRTRSRAGAEALRETDTIARNATAAGTDAAGAAERRSGTLIDDALALWRVGRSQPEACDPVFAFLADQGALTGDAYRERIDLALAQREFGLAAYLARRVGDAEQARVARWRATYRDPHWAFRHLSHRDRVALASRDPDWLYLAFDRLTIRHADESADRWARLREQAAVPPATADAISRRLALSFARDLSPRAAEALDGLDRLDGETAAWRARTAMRAGDWPALLYAVDQVDEAARDSAEWQYWRGRALAGLGRPDEAMAPLRAAAADRSYHGFLAADLVGQPYAFDHAPAPADRSVQARLAAMPAIQRAYELFRVGRFTDAHSEWAEATSPLNSHEKAQAALLAHRWGWHPSAIATAARAALWDDLDLRFPLPWQDDFEYWSSRTELAPSFALGIARSESLFYERAVSPAGAVGLMQLMPSTGRGVATRLALDWRGRSTLLEPTTNIALGTHYLSEMMRRLARHPALAAAAYNAGEHRVNRWLPDDAPIPADAWVDSVPFTETREYVQRVLMAQTIYDWKLSRRGSLPPGAPVRAGPANGTTGNHARAPADDTSATGDTALPPRLSGRMPPVPTLAALRQAR